MKPGLRGIYCVQSPKPGDAINSIGNVMCIPYSVARLKRISKRDTG